MPSHCAFNENFTVAHALHCPKEGYTHMRHNSIANLLSDVCHDVEIEPHLQPFEGETFALKSKTADDDARLDIKANGLWDSRLDETYFDMLKFSTRRQKVALKAVAKLTSTMNLSKKQV